MIVSSLRIFNVRNIAKAHFEFSPQFNCLIGPNGSGKSSFLEALSLLALGRSFRSRNFSTVLRLGERSAIVAARLRDRQGESIQAGIERGRGAPTCRIDRRRVSGIAHLVRLLPLQVATPESIELVLGGPSTRRRFLDWGVFHVEPGFHGLWRRYRRLLRQRNALLRGPSFPMGQLDVWDAALAETGEQIDALRRSYVDAFMQTQRTITPLCAEFEGIDCRYRRGWVDDLPLLEALHRARERDRRTGHTTEGPHEADLRVLINREEARRVLSRGRAKLLSFMMQAAQTALLAEAGGRRALVLIDDLSAELDPESRAWILQFFLKLGVQLFVTANAEGLIQPPTAECALFHVKHGEFSRVR